MSKTKIQGLEGPIGEVSKMLDLRHLSDDRMRKAVAIAQILHNIFGDVIGHQKGF